LQAPQVNMKLLSSFAYLQRSWPCGHCTTPAPTSSACVGCACRCSRRRPRCCVCACLNWQLAHEPSVTLPPTHTNVACNCFSVRLQVFPCGHYFCDGCAQQQLAAASPSCPYCRKHVTKAGVFRVSLAGSGAHDPELSPPEGAAVRDIKVNN
jgi:hypothetical protein